MKRISSTLQSKSNKTKPKGKWSVIKLIFKINWMALYICITHVAQTFRTFRTFEPFHSFVFRCDLRNGLLNQSDASFCFVCQIKGRVSNNNISFNQWCLAMFQVLQNAPIGYCSPSFRICDWSKIFRNSVFELICMYIIICTDALSTQTAEWIIFFFLTHQFRETKIHRQINIL